MVYGYDSMIWYNDTDVEWHAMTPQEQFLLEDDHPSVKNYLAYLQAEREAQKKREAATGDTKVPAWISLHMQVAEKRHSSSTGDVGSVVVVFFPQELQFSQVDTSFKHKTHTSQTTYLVSHAAWLYVMSRYELSCDSWFMIY